MLVNILGGDFIPSDTPKQKILVVEIGNTLPLSTEVIVLNSAEK